MRLKKTVFFQNRYPAACRYGIGVKDGIRRRICDDEEYQTEMEEEERDES